MFFVFLPRHSQTEAHTNTPTASQGKHLFTTKVSNIKYSSQYTIKSCHNPLKHGLHKQAQLLQLIGHSCQSRDP